MTATPPHRSKRLTRGIMAGWLLYWAALAIVMHAPRVPGPPVSFRMADKVVHFTAYFLLVLVGCWVGLRRRSWLSDRWVVAWFGIYAAYAALDELLQPLSNRSCELGDWLADLAGISAALLLCFGLARRTSRDESP